MNNHNVDHCCKLDESTSKKNWNLLSFSFILLTVANILLFIAFLNYNFFSNHVLIIFKYHILEIICFLTTFLLVGIDLIKKFFKNFSKKFININNIILFSSFIITFYSLFYFFYQINDIFTVNNLSDQAKDNVIFYSASLLLYFSNIGIRIEKYIFQKTEKTSNFLSELQPKYVRCFDIRTNKTKNKFYQDVEINDIVLVKKNEIIPVDGYVINEVSSIISTKVWTGDELPKSIGLNSMYPLEILIWGIILW
ncbi:hypothetical protein JTY60_02500 [symbiont of Argiope bruennichi]|uniref:P-type ATPase n=1 Tax=symbiont of Argiope bruennichi TaxID=2810479 RepID=UPI003DA5C8F7